MPNAAASRMVLEPYSEERVTATARELLAEIGGKVSCAFVFASADYRENLTDFLELIQLHGHVPTLVGCSGAGFIHTSREQEDATGFSLIFLHLPETQIRTVAFGQDEEAWEAAARAARAAHEEKYEGWIVLGDPTSLPVENWLRHWNATHPGIPCLGGLASSSGGEEGFFVFEDRHLVESAVAIGFSGGVRLETVVSQGCRPIGEPFTITGVEQNVIHSLGALPAYERLTQTVNALSSAEKLRASGNLFAGLAMSEYVDEHKTGNFLVRNLLGADPGSGALALGAIPRVGQTLQFQLRDRRSANEDLQRMLSQKSLSGVRPFAALLFSCNGRGQGLFGVPNHDAAALSEHFGPLPCAGFFCNGEIGPVGGENFVHGYTASIALLVNE
jgi:small ligand-binding sensory domain FIST